MKESPIGVAQAPLPVKIMLLILSIEALSAIAVGVWVGFEAFGETGPHLVGTLFLALVCFGLAAFLIATIRGMMQHQAWTRSAALAWQILQIGLALGSWNDDNRVVWLALVLFIPAVVVLFCVFRQSVTEWLAREVPE